MSHGSRTGYVAGAGHAASAARTLCAGRLRGVAENVYFHCVSESQRRDFLDLPRLLGVVRNGIAVERFAPPQGGPYLPAVGRCGVDKDAGDPPALANVGEHGLPAMARADLPGEGSAPGDRGRATGGIADCAGRAGVSLCVASASTGSARCSRWIDGDAGALGGAAIVCGKGAAAAPGARPAGDLADRRNHLAGGAGGDGQRNSGDRLPPWRAGEVVAEGTGFLVDNVDEMAEACCKVASIRAENCRRWVRQNYSAEAMADRYELMIEEILRE